VVQPLRKGCGDNVAEGLILIPGRKGDAEAEAGLFFNILGFEVIQGGFENLALENLLFYYCIVKCIRSGDCRRLGVQGSAEC
jgi:hypothetical protein